MPYLIGVPHEASLNDAIESRVEDGEELLLGLPDLPGVLHGGGSQLPQQTVHGASSRGQQLGDTILRNIVGKSGTSLTKEGT